VASNGNQADKTSACPAGRKMKGSKTAFKRMNPSAFLQAIKGGKGEERKGHSRQIEISAMMGWLELSLPTLRRESGKGLPNRSDATDFGSRALSHQYARFARLFNNSSADTFRGNVL